MKKLRGLYTCMETTISKTTKAQPLEKIEKIIHGQKVLVTICPPGIARGVRGLTINTTRATLQSVAQRQADKRL